jgi:hypothetical protein
MPDRIQMEGVRSSHPRGEPVARVRVDAREVGLQ